MRRSPLPRAVKPMRPRSAKRDTLMPERRTLVAALLAQYPTCQIRWDERCAGVAVEVDEIRSRAAGGSITDPANCQTTCRACHSAKHQNPLEARERGLTRMSWE